MIIEKTIANRHAEIIGALAARPTIQANEESLSRFNIQAEIAGTL